MKRFYKDATVSADLRVLLDGRGVRTPERAELRLPTAALAEAMAVEWRAQGDAIDTNTMPLNKLANTAIDRIPAHRAAIVEELAGYGGADLLSYRADDANLAIRQAERWDPLLAWARETMGADLTITTGVTHVTQPDAALAALARAVAALDNWTLAGLQTLITITGSLVLALAVAAGRLTPAEAFALSRVDEDYQAEKWGVDDEAVVRVQNLAAEVETAGKFIALAKA